MGMTGISKSQVSRLAGEIDERVNAFLDRLLEGTDEAMVSIKSADVITFSWLGSEGVVAGGVLRSWKTDTSPRKIVGARTGLSI